MVVAVKHDNTLSRSDVGLVIVDQFSVPSDRDDKRALDMRNPSPFDVQLPPPTIPFLPSPLGFGVLIDVLLFVFVRRWISSPGAEPFEYGIVCFFLKCPSPRLVYNNKKHTNIQRRGSSEETKKRRGLAFLNELLTSGCISS